MSQVLIMCSWFVCSCCVHVLYSMRTFVHVSVTVRCLLDLLIAVQPRYNPINDQANLFWSRRNHVSVRLKYGHGVVIEPRSDVHSCRLRAVPLPLAVKRSPFSYRLPQGK